MRLSFSEVLVVIACLVILATGMNWTIQTSAISEVDVSSNDDPGLIFNGDDHFEFNGSRARSGLFELSPDISVDWASGRHSAPYRAHFWSYPGAFSVGNIGFADGHVDQFTAGQLHELPQCIDPQANRIVIP